MHNSIQYKVSIIPRIGNFRVAVGLGFRCTLAPLIVLYGCRNANNMEHLIAVSNANRMEHFTAISLTVRLRLVV